MANNNNNNTPVHRGEEESQSAAFKCDQCEKTFMSEKSLVRHVKAKHSGVTFPCTICGKTFEYVGHRTRHEKTCNPGPKQFDCNICRKRCATEGGLRRHQESHQRVPPAVKSKKAPKRKMEEPVAGPSGVTKKAKRSSKEFRCRRCQDTFTNRRDLYNHGMRHHYQVGGGLQPVPWGENPAPWENQDGTIDEPLQDVYEINAPIILEEHQLGPVVSSYNFPIGNDVTVSQLVSFFEEIYQREQRAFRVNFTFGMVLQNRETSEYRYFRPYTNNTVLESPIYISKREDLKKIENKIENMDLTTELVRNRPDTKWVPVLITNVVVKIYTTDYPLGAGILPDYLRNHHAIVPLEVNKQTGQTYDDFLCAFRCLAVHRGYDVKSLEGVAREYYQQWCVDDGTKFLGIQYGELPKFEEKFQINLEVYSLHENQWAECIYKSMGRYMDTMYLNMYKNHLSYIKDFPGYAKKFQCQTCDRHFDMIGHLHRHQATCINKTKYVFPGGFFKSNKTIFEKLEQFGIVVQDSERFFPWFITYDLEALLEKVAERNTDRLIWTQKHVPISVSICSNVEGHIEPQCIVNPDQEQLTEKFIKVLESIAVKVKKMAQERWGWVLEKLNEKLQEVTPDEEKETEGDDLDDEEPDELGNKMDSNALKSMIGQMMSYMMQVPVLGFNSSRYDLNLLKQKIARHLKMHEEKDTFVVKKNNAYSCISSPTLKFLDIMQFLAPGTSYSKFLKAYDVDEAKGFFPYEWLTDASKLESTSLPPHEAFYSSLKGKNITEEEYKYCQSVWEDQNMTCFRDFLIWYNNLDVGPFVKAVERLQEFYFLKDIDVFKIAMTVPGIARQMLFKIAKEEGANFSLFSRADEDLYHTFKNNIVGGPSIIFNRHQQAGKTRIRGDKLCKKVVGFDANALYLWAIDQKMPVGPFIRRKAPGFRPEVRDKFMSAYHWMDWMNFNNGTNIKHKLNCGEEKRVGKYPVDGWDAATNTIYQFHGCYYHGHVCSLTRDVKDKIWWKKRQSKLNKTEKTTQFLKNKGFNVIEMWECEFKEYRRCHPKIVELIDQSRPTFYRKHKKEVTEANIIEGVKDGELFGAVEVDIEVPEQWPDHFNHPLSPYEYFREMSPLFCTTDVPHDVIGDHMQQHVKKHNLSTKPKRLLVGGMKGRNLLLATPLLRWYLQHGMKVTKIHQVVEYLPQACFKRFVRDVSEARRLGDVHPDKSIIADTMKLVGNCGFGSMIMDKTKHKDVVYVQDEGPACLLINQPLFRKMECLDPEQQFYEAELAKGRIRLDLPIQLGYFILQYAKLRMLEFYYDFMDVYVDRSDFEYCEMDTDSAYMAISGNSIDEVIRSSMKEKYEEGLKGFCIDTDIEADASLHWFPRTCCQKHSKYDKRTAGLFKLEYEGEEIIGLCSKTYIVRKEVTSDEKVVNEYKFSSKGVNKNNIQDPMSFFRNVLDCQTAANVTNRGFRVRNNTMYTYTQEKRGFSYFYCKRRVCNNGIDTEPLDIVLSPISENKQQKGEAQMEEEIELTTKQKSDIHSEIETVQKQIEQECSEMKNENQYLETQMEEEQTDIDEEINDFEMLELLLDLAEEH